MTAVNPWRSPERCDKDTGGKLTTDGVTASAMHLSCDFRKFSKVIEIWYRHKGNYYGLGKR
jgi:hypothetical protein